MKELYICIHFQSLLFCSSIFRCSFMAIAFFFQEPGGRRPPPPPVGGGGGGGGMGVL